jgi:hypothetical protein
VPLFVVSAGRMPVVSPATGAKDKEADKSAQEVKRGPYRTHPQHTLEQVLIVPQKIRDEMAGKPMRRLLLADALGIKPSSSNYRDLLSSSAKYGLTEGSEKAAEIRLTATGSDVTQNTDPAKRRSALRQAATAPKVFGSFYQAYDDNKLPSMPMISKILVSDFGIPVAHADECATLLVENGRWVGIIRDISGSPHVMLNADSSSEPLEAEVEVEEVGDIPEDVGSPLEVAHLPESPQAGRPLNGSGPRSIFVGHGKNKGNYSAPCLRAVYELTVRGLVG